METVTKNDKDHATLKQQQQQQVLKRDGQIFNSYIFLEKKDEGT